MLDADSLLYERFKSSRPGYDLIAIEEAALPVTVVRTEILAQESKPVPLLDEFVLRLVETGIRDAAGMARFLGLDEGLVKTTIADQLHAGELARRPDQRFALTQRGTETVRDLVTMQPVHTQTHLSFDRLIWGILPYNERDFITKKDAQEAGMMLLPALQKKRISLDDISADDINRQNSTTPKGKNHGQVLSVRRVHPHTHRYLPVRLLVFADKQLGEKQLAVAVDGEPSPAHERALIEADAAEKLSIRVAPPEERPAVEPHLEALRVSTSEVEELIATAAPARPTPTPADLPRRANPAAAAEASLNALQVRSVSVFEHRALLREALTTAKKRILIISPWIKSAVVTTAFLADLERRLRENKVTVDIAYGIGDDDSGSDARAIELLRNLQKRHERLMTFTRLKNTHAKILIYDDKWINTSFNWLSFRGDPDRTYRMEEGTLIQIPAEVEKAYDQYRTMIEQQKAD